LISQLQGSFIAAARNEKGDLSPSALFAENADARNATAIGRGVFQDSLSHFSYSVLVREFEHSLDLHAI
jgi:hypothetical protein